MITEISDLHLSHASRTPWLLSKYFTRTLAGTIPSSWLAVFEQFSRGTIFCTGERGIEIETVALSVEKLTSLKKDSLSSQLCRQLV